MHLEMRYEHWALSKVEFDMHTVLFMFNLKETLGLKYSSTKIIGFDD